MIIPIYGLSWHIRKSPALRELLTLPLISFIQFEQFGWDGEKLPHILTKKQKSKPVVFFQLPPPKELMSSPETRIVWIPMWDQAYGYDLSWWQKLPKSLRVVAFSEQVKIRAQAVGLKTLSLRYCVNPDNISPATWDKKRILFYWNRVGMYSPEFLSKLCEVLEIDLLLFRSGLDPLIDKNFEFSLPPKIGATVVQDIPGFDSFSHKEYKELMDQVNIMLAPRPLEGVGLTFIEMMARGNMIFGLDAPTMNEYIQHGANGYLFQDPRRSKLSTLQFRINRAIKRFYLQISQKKEHVDYLITEKQDWLEISKLNLQKMGEKARRDQLSAFQTWENNIPRYAEFILDW